MYQNRYNLKYIVNDIQTTGNMNGLLLINPTISLLQLTMLNNSINAMTKQYRHRPQELENLITGIVRDVLSKYPSSHPITEQKTTPSASAVTDVPAVPAVPAVSDDSYGSKPSDYSYSSYSSSGSSYDSSGPKPKIGPFDMLDPSLLDTPKGKATKPPSLLSESSSDSYGTLLDRLLGPSTPVKSTGKTSGTQLVLKKDQIMAMTNSQLSSGARDSFATVLSQIKPKDLRKIVAIGLNSPLALGTNLMKTDSNILRLIDSNIQRIPIDSPDGIYFINAGLMAVIRDVDMLMYGAVMPKEEMLKQQYLLMIRLLFPQEIKLGDKMEFKDVLGLLFAGSETKNTLMLESAFNTAVKPSTMLALTDRSVKLSATNMMLLQALLNFTMMAIERKKAIESNSSMKNRFPALAELFNTSMTTGMTTKPLSTSSFSMPSLPTTLGATSSVSLPASSSVSLLPAVSIALLRYGMVHETMKVAKRLYIESNPDLSQKVKQASLKLQEPPIVRSIEDIHQILDDIPKQIRLLHRLIEGGQLNEWMINVKSLIRFVSEIQHAVNTNFGSNINMDNILRFHSEILMDYELRLDEDETFFSNPNADWIDYYEMYTHQFEMILTDFINSVKPLISIEVMRRKYLKFKAKYMKLKNKQ